MARSRDRQNRNQTHAHQITMTPITFAECVTRIILSPDTPSGMLGEFGKYEITADVALAKRVWSPNVHMEAYQKRKAKKQHDRILGLI